MKATLLILSLSLVACSCVSLKDLKIYATSSELGAIVRSQDNEIIYCQEPEFDNMVCVSNDDYAKIVKKLQLCSRRKR